MERTISTPMASLLLPPIIAKLTGKTSIQVQAFRRKNIVPTIPTVEQLLKRLTTFPPTSNPMTTIRSGSPLDDWYITSTRAPKPGDRKLFMMRLPMPLYSFLRKMQLSMALSTAIWSK